MRAWLHRPKEEAHLLNPAFCCSTLAAAVSGYSDVKSNGMPFPLVFMVLPIVLHKPTRELLPPNARTSMPAWLQHNSSVRVLFFDHLISLKPYTQEALHFGFLYNWLRLQEDGHIQSTKSRADIDKAIRSLDGESHECVMKARFLGKWFASMRTPYTVMALWGIRP